MPELGPGPYRRSRGDRRQLPGRRPLPDGRRPGRPRRVRRADAPLLRTPRYCADRLPGDDQGDGQDAAHARAHRRRLRRFRPGPQRTRAGRRRRPDHGRHRPGLRGVPPLHQLHPGPHHPDRADRRQCGDQGRGQPRPVQESAGGLPRVAEGHPGLLVPRDPAARPGAQRDGRADQDRGRGTQWDLRAAREVRRGPAADPFRPPRRNARAAGHRAPRHLRRHPDHARSRGAQPPGARPRPRDRVRPHLEPDPGVGSGHPVLPRSRHRDRHGPVHDHRGATRVHLGQRPGPDLLAAEPDRAGPHQPVPDPRAAAHGYELDHSDARRPAACGGTATRRQLLLHQRPHGRRARPRRCRPTTRCVAPTPAAVPARTCSPRRPIREARARDGVDPRGRGRGATGQAGHAGQHPGRRPRAPRPPARGRRRARPGLRCRSACGVRAGQRTGSLPEPVHHAGVTGTGPAGRAHPRAGLEPARAASWSRRCCPGTSRARR